MKNFLRRLPFFSLSILTTAVILYLTLVPHPIPEEDIPLIPGLDKIVHGIMFGGLTLTLCIDYSRKWHDFKAVPLGMLICFATCSAAFGGLVEIAQGAMGLGRGADVVDWGADIAGCILFALIVNPLLRVIRRERPPER